MKIAIISFYSGISPRGAETFVHELAERLAVTAETTVFQTGVSTPRTKYNLARVKNFSLKQERFATTNWLRRLFLTPRQLIEFCFYLKCLPKILRGKFDVVMPVNAGWHTPFLKFFSVLLKFKLIISGQSGPGWDDRWNLFWHPDLFIALTQTQTEWARKHCWKGQKMATIPNGVDLAKFSSKGRGLKVTLPKPVVLTVGASIPSKRLDTTIRAVAQMNGSLLLVGTGYLDRKIDELGNALLPNRFLHLKLKHSQIALAFRTADIFTLASDSSEAFGIVYLEALASGLPVVATDDDSRREILGMTSFFVSDPNDTAEYSEAIMKALRNKDPVSARKIASKYDWDEIAKKYLLALDFK